ncbi:MAG: glycosyltransferase family 4 protein [Bacteroidales bacterium]|nr:glycosyltransferase family 4 protein [Bacteroidales bacterium]
MQIKICHITTVHPRYDVRIFIKECKSLAKKYEDVNLIVADGKGDEIVDGIKFFDVGKPSGRIQRILKYPRKAFKKAIEIDADIYHFHDSELLSTGVKLAKKGNIVIYDSHEDLPRQILTKPWIPKFLRKVASRIAERTENRKVRRLSAVVAATPHIKERFEKVTSAPVKNVNNYPVLDDIMFNPSWNDKENAVCYVGGLFYTRGIHEMVAAIGKTDSKLIMGGNFSPASLINELTNKNGWKKVEYLGFIDREKVNEVYRKSVAGLIMLHPMPSYIDSLPVKMFEYMAAGIPIICSDFPLWKEIVETAGCGVCVNPFDAEAIANEITRFCKDKETARKMGENGRKAVEKTYNWATQEKELIDLYDNIINK